MQVSCVIHSVCKHQDHFYIFLYDYIFQEISHRHKFQNRSGNPPLAIQCCWLHQDFRIFYDTCHDIAILLSASTQILVPAHQIGQFTNLPEWHDNIIISRSNTVIVRQYHLCHQIMFLLLIYVHTTYDSFSVTSSLSSVIALKTQQ